MKICGISNNVNFRQIKLDVTLSISFLEKNGEKCLNRIQNMSLNGYPIGTVTYDKNKGVYSLNGLNPSTNQSCHINLGPYITAEQVENAINFYNMNSTLS